MRDARGSVYRFVRLRLDGAVVVAHCYGPECGLMVALPPGEVEPEDNVELAVVQLAKKRRFQYLRERVVL